MSFATAKLFDWLQGADFYHDAHRAAVEQLPPGNDKLWVDVGCGPGLVTRLAAARGYRAIGIDCDRHMISVAQWRAIRANSSAEFKLGDLGSLAVITPHADVISAASLLAVVEDKSAALHALLAAIKPGGYLLIIEPTAAMTPSAADTLLKNGLGGKRANGLRLWARARHGRATNPELLNVTLAKVVHHESLLSGLLGVWVLQTLPGTVPNLC